MASLLKRALELNAGGPGMREKFVFVSESTLPAKSFGIIHSTLLQDDDSDFCLFPSNQWGSAQIDGLKVQLVKHHQWVVLNKAHADMFVKEWVPVDSRSVWHVWLRGGSWEGRERYLSPQHFYHPASANWCTDEWAFMATIYGAVEPMHGIRTLPSFGGGPIYMHGPASLTSQGRCRTFSYWDNYDTASGSLAATIFRDVHGSQMSCYPRCIARPATLHRLSDNSLRALQASPFLFVRKFDASAWMPNYQTIILSFPR